MQAFMKNNKILLISPIPTHPATSGNRARVLSLARIIKEEGYQLYFLHIKWREGDVHLMKEFWGNNYFSCDYVPPKTGILLKLLRRIYRKLGLEKAYRLKLDEWYDTNVDRCIKKLNTNINFDVVVVEYVFFSKALNNFSNETLKILDTHDVFADRHKHYIKQGQQPTWYSTSKREEGKGFNRADYVIAIQDKEYEFIRDNCKKKVVVVGHNIDISTTDTSKAMPNRVLFLASGNGINKQAADFLVNRVIPLVTQELSDVEFVICGGISDVLPEIKGVVKLGRVSDLVAVYSSAALVVNPVHIGTGLKIKTIEALAHGKPLVTTSVGAEGIEQYSGKAFLIGNTPEEFAQAVVLLLSDTELANKLAIEGRNLIENYNKENINVLNAMLNREL
jgi:glycosyltransferase involved in cell wall biosynthesis